MDVIKEIFSYIEIFIYSICTIGVLYWLFSTSVKEKKEGLVNHLKEKKKIMTDFKDELDKRDINFRKSDKNKK
ncbi:hypothetical protein Fleli_0140 [Bernardetia litoralis DSM 6794]|uniref:Uncharacterized protein n=1 Tax=Bernardetia litoralis (strain ATCC 23117 / DSM 6794 / NBRC 15988 / NCIMB 1366 / Fx l1 / Sio-4) TaxID=880071 RepID=I4AFA5_BERLS|nr:hypothetical protein [Bernardetia litoralis]AFM02640.1 hypothetical protein Fleli_0140 [Bernardetia litoralis DSM 6794]